MLSLIERDPLSEKELYRHNFYRPLYENKMWNVWGIQYILTIFAHNYDNKINSHYIKFVKEKKPTSASNEVAGVIFLPLAGIHALTWCLLLLYYQPCPMVTCTPLYTGLSRSAGLTVSPISLFEQVISRLYSGVCLGHAFCVSFGKDHVVHTL